MPRPGSAVPPERLARWLAGVAQRQGGVDVEPTPDDPSPGDTNQADPSPAPEWAQRIWLRCGDGSRWEVLVPFPPIDGDWVDHVCRDRRLGLLLIRRGGWAVGVADGPSLVASRVGRAYVQARTAAGGWSQQRYARRRAGQVAGLVTDLVVATEDLLVAGAGASARPLDAVVTGGDRLLLRQAADDRRLAPLRCLPPARVLDVPDPRLAVLEGAVGAARSVLVRQATP